MTAPRAAGGVRVFRSFAEADAAEDELYASLTPQARVDILLDLIVAYREATGASGTCMERVNRVMKLGDAD